MHYSELIAIDTWLLTLYAIFFRFGSLPRLIAGFGIAVVLLHLVAIPLSGLLGYGINTTLGIPLAFGMVANAVCLLCYGKVSRSGNRNV